MYMFTGNLSVISRQFEKDTQPVMSPVPSYAPTVISSASLASAVPSYLLEDSATESDPDQYEYKWSENVSKQRAVEASTGLKTILINTLLKDATLTKTTPYVYSYQWSHLYRSTICHQYMEALTRLTKVYPIQNAVWPYILQGRSTFLIGKTDYYPHLLYLPALVTLIKVMIDY